MFEGTIVDVPKGGRQNKMRGETVKIDTTNILFICAGAFSGLDKVIDNRISRSSIGFAAPLKVILIISSSVCSLSLSLSLSSSLQ
jgi:ATP-dependent Clp protease ATP-binding subunit ClpX